MCPIYTFSLKFLPVLKIKPTALNGQLRFFNLLMASFFVENVLVKTGKYAQYAVASHYYKTLFCENSDVRGDLSIIFSTGMYLEVFPL